MILPSYFNDFLAEIRLNEKQRTECRDGHRTLRQKLLDDKDIGNLIVNSFLQGSYRRSTAVQPQGSSKPDVDVIIVTTIDKDQYTPAEALEYFIPFLKREYPKYRLQGRSIGLELEHIDLDLVITAAPSESERDVLKSDAASADQELEEAADWRLAKSWHPAGQLLRFRDFSLMEKASKDEEWRTSVLYIPDRDADEWTPTNPLEQIRWTRDKNKTTIGHYVNVVKAIKWWRKRACTSIEHPKGYPVEHLVGDCCLDDITSVAEGVTKMLETAVELYAENARVKSTPTFPDRGVPEHDLFKRITGADFAAFYGYIKVAARVARKALDAATVKESATLWRELFGDAFPSPPSDDDSSKGGYTPRVAASVVSEARFA
jgi:hypothetical protein